MSSWMGKTWIPATTEIWADACLLGVRSLVANRVYDGQGNLVGRVEEIVIDTRSGCVRHAVLAVGGILGIGCRRLAVPWVALKPDADYCRCVVDMTQLYLMGVPVPVNDPWLRRKYSTQASENNSRRTRTVGATSL